MSLWLKFEIHAPWHIGTGTGTGLGADALTVRGASGLPEIPGRAVKGLLRDAFSKVEQTGSIASGRTAQLFGSAPGSKGNEEASIAARQEMERYQSEPGSIQIDSARLGADSSDQQKWQDWAATDESTDLVDQMTQEVSSTRLDQGVAAKGSLRTVEVALPLTLHAEVGSLDSDEQWKDEVRLAAGMLRAVGKMRHRGFGRCTVSVVEEGGSR